MPSTSLNGIELYYEIHGQGEPLMLVAGLGSDSQSWLPVLGDLARHFRVILLDNRGSGRTTPQECENSIQLMADDCLALCDHLKLPTVTLLGHSMGGFVAQDFCIRYSERVSQLILAATSACNSSRNTALFRDWVAYLKSGMEPELWFRSVFFWIFSKHFFEAETSLREAIQYAVDYPYPQSTTAFEKQVAALAEFDCRDKLPRIQQPTLLMCGEQDLLFGPEESLNVLDTIPNTSVAMIEDTGHSVAMENPQAFSQCILEYMLND